MRLDADENTPPAISREIAAYRVWRLKGSHRPRLYGGPPSGRLLRQRPRPGTSRLPRRCDRAQAGRTAGCRARRDRSRRRPRPDANCGRACPEAAQGEGVAGDLNGAGQVIAAPTHMNRAGLRAKELGAKRVVPLPVSAPFHWHS